MTLRTLALAGVAASLFALPALAHHSFAMFDQATTTSVSGTVMELEWINPHVWLHIEVTKDDGSTEEWSFEAGSTGQLSQSFWTADSVQPGETINVNFHPLKDGSNGGQLIDVTKDDGTWLCQGAACRDQLREQGLIPQG
jgi:hypothetical protein